MTHFRSDSSARTESRQGTREGAGAPRACGQDRRSGDPAVRERPFGEAARAAGSAPPPAIGADRAGSEGRNAAEAAAPAAHLAEGGVRRQRLVLYHPNSSGKGAAMQLEPRLNRGGSDRYNCFFMEMAAQRTVAARGGEPAQPASFDWEKKLTVKLGFEDICEMLAVLEGRAESLGGQRKGLFHRNGDATTIISLQKADHGGYFLGLSRKGANDDSATRLNITLSEAEAIGLRAVFQTGLFFITFHSHLFAAASGADGRGTARGLVNAETGGRTVAA